MGRFERMGVVGVHTVFQADFSEECNGKAAFGGSLPVEGN